MPKKIVMLDPRGRIGKAEGEVITRHIKYANALGAELSNDSSTSLHVYSISKLPREPEVYESLRIQYISCPTYNLPGFAKEVVRHLKKSKQSQIAIVAGDTWISAITARIIQQKIRKRIPLQVQCHFDVQDLYGRSRFSFLQGIKRLTFIYFLRTSNQMRLVNFANATFLGTKYPKLKDKFFVAPSILNMPPLGSTKPRSTGMIQIGWVGRFHQERNPEGFVGLIKKLNLAGVKMRVVLIGDGPLRSQTIRAIRQVNSGIEIEQMGHLVGEDYFNALAKIDILISTAKAESFGRALREGVISGCRIWSVETTGFNELRRQLGDKALQPLFLEKPPDELAIDFSILAGSEILQDSQEILISEQERNQKSLIQSWVTLLDVNQGE